MIMMDQDRLNHSIAVARKMVEIGKKYNLDDEQLQELFLLGYNHDIGYEFGNNENHRIIDGKILKQSNNKYWQEVYYHGEVESEYSSLYLDILNKADMQIDKFGNDVGHVKRLEDIKNRYGKESDIYKKAEKLIEHINN